MVMIEVIANDRLGKKVRVKCDSEDTVGDLKVIIAAPSLRRIYPHSLNNFLIAETYCGSDGYRLAEDCSQEMVYIVQRPHQTLGL
jgi:hypothetical protein